MHRRTVFDHDDWERHKSNTRHFRHLFTIVSTKFLLAFKSPVLPVLAVTFISAIISAFNHIVLREDIFPEWVSVLQVSSLPFTLTAPVLALLLVFRTNGSYGRFDEARKAWGSNVNRTRDIVRQALSWIRSPEDSYKLQSLIRHVKAYAYCLKDHLLTEEQLKDDLTDLLEEPEMESLMGSEHRPNYVLQVISEIIHQTQMDQLEKTTIDQNLTQLHDNVGACERIFRTPIPLPYTRLTSRFLVIWHVTLPLAMWEQCGWVVVPVTFLSAAALFCIEEVGVLIEEPFWILPLTAICSTIRKNLEGLVLAQKEATQLRSVYQAPQTMNGMGHSARSVQGIELSRSSIEHTTHHHHQMQRSRSWVEQAHNKTELSRSWLDNAHIQLAVTEPSSEPVSAPFTAIGHPRSVQSAELSRHSVEYSTQGHPRNVQSAELSRRSVEYSTRGHPRSVQSAELSRRSVEYSTHIQRSRSWEEHRATHTLDLPRRSHDIAHNKIECSRTWVENAHIHLSVTEPVYQTAPFMY